MNKDNNFNTLFTGRNTRFFYDKNYVDKNLFENCITNNKSNNKDISQEYCLKKYKIHRIISNSQNLQLNKDKFNCSYSYSSYGSRNPFNRRKIRIEVCDKNILE